jgi:iron complex outermembrane receptor protein
LQAATIVVGNVAVLTDKNGRFSISLHSGNHRFVVTHAGYRKTVQEVTMGPGKIQTLDITLTSTEALGEVVVLGSRSLVHRSNLSTPVPVDVITANQLVQTGQASLTQMLQFAVPSFNTSRAVVNEPVTPAGP